MQAFQTHKGLAAVLDRSNVDTDQIIPKQFLKKIERKGFGAHLFHDWRFLDPEGRTPNPEFELNQKRYAGASVLVSGENFGCGSSREHAPWALQDYGFRVLLAPSFADIFYNNCLKNGLLTISLATEELRSIMNWVLKREGAQISVDLTKQILYAKGKEHSFTINPLQKEKLLRGRDEIDLSLRHKDKILKFEKKHFQDFPFYRLSRDTF